jgi:uncharacterized cupredoxin-like copper-binding protein
LTSTQIAGAITQKPPQPGVDDRLDWSVRPVRRGRSALVELHLIDETPSDKPIKRGGTDYEQASQDHRFSHARRRDAPYGGDVVWVWWWELRPTDEPATSVDAATTAHVTLNEWKIDAPTTLKAGDITFDVKNAGTTPHEFVVIKSGADPTSFAMADGGKIDEEAVGVSPGESGDIEVGGEKTVTPHLDPGTYVFLCNLPGHYMSGMRGELIVT